VRGAQMRAVYARAPFVSDSEMEACQYAASKPMTTGCSMIVAEAAPAPEVHAQGALFYTPRNVAAFAEATQALSVARAAAASLAQSALRRDLDFCCDRCACETAAALIPP
jgi:hypothetical protein